MSVKSISEKMSQTISLLKGFSKIYEFSMKVITQYHIV